MPLTSSHKLLTTTYMGKFLIYFMFYCSFFRNLVSGFTDTSPAVRESTVKAMVTFAEKLNYHNLNNDLMKYLARLQGYF